MLGDIAQKKEVKKAGAKLSCPAFGHVIKKLKIWQRRLGAGDHWNLKMGKHFAFRLVQLPSS